VTATIERPRPAPRSRRRQRTQRTAASLRTLLITLVVLSLAWGALGGWVADQHASAASAMNSVDVPLSLDAQQLYQDVADADVTATTMLLASAQPPLSSTQRYANDIDGAEARLSALRAAGGQDQAESAALDTLARDLPVYAGYVAEARSDYGLGYPVTGGSLLQDASEEAHLDLLPAAKTVFDQRNDALGAASAQATGLPLTIVALVLAIIIAVVLFRAQRWLTRRTNRVLNVGLALASVVLVVSALWLLAGFLAGRSDLDTGIAHGSQPAQDLAQASIGVQQIRGDAVLNVISRSGDTSFQSDFTATSKAVGPGPGSLLSAAAAAQASGSQAGPAVTEAEGQASSWYTANAKVYTLGADADYAAERDQVIGGGPSSSAAQYNALEPDITRAIADDQSDFSSAVSQGSGALSPLEPVVLVAALLMALLCVWGLRRRLAEYR
jgi:hypothetical protein